MASINYSDPKNQRLPATAKQGMIPCLTKDANSVSDRDTIPLEFCYPTLSTLDIDTLSVDKKLKLSQLLDLGAQRNIQVIVPTSDVVGTMILNKDQFIYKNDAVYGLRRIREADVTSFSDRADVVPTVLPYRALNGQGGVDLWNASYQWLTYGVAATNVWSIELVLETGNTGNNRRLTVNGVNYPINQGIGDLLFRWVSPGVSGYTSVTAFGYREDTDDRTIIKDHKVLASNNITPNVVTAQGLLHLLQVGDRFRLESQGINTLLRYEGIDPVSKAWKATPVANLGNFDTQLIIGSRNAVENNAIALKFAEIIGIVPDSGNSLEKIWNKLQTAGQDWFLVDTIADRDALGTIADKKYVRVLQGRKDAQNNDIWIIYQGKAVFTDDPLAVPTMSWIELFDKTNGGSSELVTLVSNLQTDNSNLKTDLTTLTNTFNLFRTAATNTISTLSTTVQNLLDRLTTLENRPVSIGSANFVESESPPNFNESWNVWQQTERTATGYKLKIWMRNESYNDAILLDSREVPINEGTALLLEGTTYREAIAPYVVVDFTKEKVSYPNGLHNRVKLTVPANVYSNWAYKGLDSNGLEIDGTGGGSLVAENATVIDTFVRSLDAVRIQVTLTPVDTNKSLLVYSFATL